MQSKKKKGREPKYDNAFKIAIARDYLESDLGYLRLGAKYNVPTGTVRDFVKWYELTYAVDSEKVKQEPKAVEPISDTENKQLQKELEEARLKIAGLEMLIEIAQKELGVDIIKKPGTKQSTK